MHVSKRATGNTYIDLKILSAKYFPFCSGWLNQKKLVNIRPDDFLATGSNLSLSGRFFIMYDKSKSSLRVGVWVGLELQPVSHHY